jgi:hypothetical protein
MASQSLPRALSEVVSPLQEAEAYEKFQWLRRRGIFGGLVALTWLVFGIGRLADPGFEGADWVFWFSLVVIACFIAGLLWAKKRPAWKGVFTNTDSLVVRTFKQGPKTRFVLLLLALYAFGGILLGLHLLARDSTSPLLLSAASSAEILVSTALVAYALRKLQDGAMPVSLVVSAVWVVPILFGIVPQGIARAFWDITIGGSWLLLSLFRLAAPRGWLVRG